MKYCTYRKTKWPRRPDWLCDAHKRGYVDNGESWQCQEKKAEYNRKREPKHGVTDINGYWNSRNKGWAKAPNVPGLPDGILFPDGMKGHEWYILRWDEQEGRCANLACQKWAPMIGTKGQPSLQVDHCHYTRKPRALLCGRCNYRLTGKIEGLVRKWGITWPMLIAGLEYIHDWYRENHHEFYSKDTKGDGPPK